MPALSPSGVPSAASLPPEDPASVTLGRCFPSSRPKVIDDFSGSGLLSLLRMMARLRNLDGPDDVAGAFPAGFSQAQQPYIEIGLLALLFPLVAISAKGAVQSAQAGYAKAYPDSVRQTLDQQQWLIEALRHDDGQADEPGGRPDDELARLETLHRLGVLRFEERQQHRARGFLPLLKHNVVSKWHRRPGSARLAEDFNREAADVIAARFECNRRLEAPDASYQHHLARKLGDEQGQAKRGRTAALFTGIGMPGMASGMVVSAGACAATAGGAAAQASGHGAGQVAAHAVERALDAATAGIMMGAQAAQGVAGVLNDRLHLAQHRQIRRDRAALQAIAADLPPRTRELHAQDTRFRLSDSTRSQVCDAMLTAGQGLMLGSSVSSLACPPVALPLAVPGALLTIGASICTSVNETHRQRYLGERTVEPVKAQMRLGNLGQRLREAPLDRVLREVAGQFDGHQDQLVRTRLWRDILAVLKDEDLDAGGPPRAPHVRYRRLLDRNGGRRRASPLLPAGVERLHQWRRTHYPEDWFEGPVRELHERLSAELLQHPASALIQRLPVFQRDVLFATATDLARRRDPGTQALFRDADGRRLKTLRADERFFAHLDAHPAAKAVYLKHHNETLARYLTPVDRFGRADTRDALTDLAHLLVARRARTDPPPSAA
ncbi:hypothetical protein [Mitsuaria sp. 7]|uniref:hypothetical protein n=1 Tax=Mitsuaria sp. 7 TaxID=1658665 RepID=UPI0007DCFA44|nr:hypothetical protein [Mitsuaria sp. 7]ANH67942.1 hypothetical protein ABE85_10795 [Mitsuaria sp. 7]